MITAARNRGATRVEITAPAQERFLAFVRARVGRTMFFSPTCAGSNSYYIDNNGDAAFLRPTAGLHAIWSQKTFDLNDYRFDTTTVSRPDRRPGTGFSIVPAWPS
ncbi:hypothetical protein [Nocardia terpenica]|uniref:hypothetical protein n=1 Tax=Nocardia terpenica TaxID=455432 RepID=UPI001E3A5E6D|nr:hypothetical protein [Nocardia terpenica]